MSVKVRSRTEELEQRCLNLQLSVDIESKLLYIINTQYKAEAELLLIVLEVLKEQADSGKASDGYLIKSYRAIGDQVHQTYIESGASGYYVDLPGISADVKSKYAPFTGSAGWYQDIDGNLYKYDGVVWDVVPECKLSELEYLG